MIPFFTKRSLNDKCLFIDNDGQEKMLTNFDACLTYKIDGIIRIHQKDYQNFPEPIGLFTHFNLEYSGHCLGKLYALPRIIKPGFFIDQKNEQLPLLDFKNCYMAECIDVEEGVAYEKLDADVWQYSFSHIKDINALQQEILWRYKKSLPRISAEELLANGVGITYLRIVGKV